MTRIVAGRAGGRRLAVPPGSGTRPTSDRVREALFSSLASELGTDGFAGLAVLDLYAGTGALGLEALSRGAASAMLVESDRRAVQVLQANIAAVGLPGARVVTGRAERVERWAAGDPYGLVFADPPYDVAAATLAGILTALLDASMLAADALVVVERRRGDAWEWPDGLVATRDRTYGDTTLWYGHRAAHTEGPTVRTAEGGGEPR